MSGVNLHKCKIDVEERYLPGGENRWLLIDDLVDELVGSHSLDKLPYRVNT